MDRRLKVWYGIILAYVAYSFYEPFWRLLIRGSMEPNFSWGYMGIGGTGVSGDYWVIMIIAALSLLLMFFGWRGGNRAVQWGILAWVTMLFLSSLAIVISDPGTKIIAETLHTEFPYIWSVFPVDALFFVLTAAWMIRTRKVKSAASGVKWHRVNSLLIGLAAALLPVEYLLLNGGEQHGLLDGIGITFTLVQWVLINLAFYPWRRRERSAESELSF